MNAIGLDFAEFVSFRWLPKMGMEGAIPRRVRWDDIQADFVIRRIADGIGQDRGHLYDPHPARGSRTYLMGAYIVLYPQSNMLAQVTNALAMYRERDDWDLPPSIDCEVAYTNAKPAVRWQQIEDFSCAIEDGIGRSVGDYTRKDWWDKYTMHPHEAGWISKRPLWLALAANMRRDACPRDWWSWTIWQKLFNCHAQGVTGYVDVNEFSGSREELDAWSKKWLLTGG